MKDELPTPEWKNKIWKDGIANIDEHLNGWGKEGSASQYANEIKKHVWAMNEVQRFFVEDTRLGIPVDFTNEGLRGVAYTTATSFPSEIAMGGTWDTGLESQVGHNSDRVRAWVCKCLRSTLDVPRDQVGDIRRYFGEDPYLVSRMALQWQN